MLPVKLFFKKEKRVSNYSKDALFVKVSRSDLSEKALYLNDGFFPLLIPLSGASTRWQVEWVKESGRVGQPFVKKNQESA